MHRSPTYAFKYHKSPNRIWVILMNKYKIKANQTDNSKSPNILNESVSAKKTNDTAEKQAGAPGVRAQEYGEDRNNFNMREPEYRPRRGKIWPAALAAGVIAVGAYYAGSHHSFEHLVGNVSHAEQQLQKKVQQPPKQVEVVNHYITRVVHVYTAVPAKTVQSPQQSAQSMQYNLQNQQQNMQYNLQEQQLAAQKRAQQMQYQYQIQQMHMQAQAQAQQMALQQQQQQMQYQIQQEQMAQQRIQNWSYAAQNLAGVYNYLR